MQVAVPAPPPPVGAVRRFRLSSAQQELLKWLAVALMTLDHANRALWPFQGWVFALGRLAFPLFAFRTAYNPAVRGVSARRYGLPLLAFGALAQFPAMGALDHGPLPLNIMFTLLLGVTFLPAVRLLRRFMPGWLAAANVTLVWGTLARSAEYGPAGVLLVPAFGLLLSSPSVVTFTLAAFLTLAANLFVPTALVPLALPLLVWGAAQLKLGPFPRLRWAAYAFYPGHLTLLDARRAGPKGRPMNLWPQNEPRPARASRLKERRRILKRKLREAERQSRLEGRAGERVVSAVRESRITDEQLGALVGPPLGRSARWDLGAAHQNALVGRLERKIRHLGKERRTLTRQRSRLLSGSWLATKTKNTLAEHALLGMLASGGDPLVGQVEAFDRQLEKLAVERAALRRDLRRHRTRLACRRHDAVGRGVLAARAAGTVTRADVEAVARFDDETRRALEDLGVWVADEQASSP